VAAFLVNCVSSQDYAGFLTLGWVVRLGGQSDGTAPIPSKALGYYGVRDPHAYAGQQFRPVARNILSVHVCTFYISIASNWH
jgi:hypothetical protein